MYFLIGTVLLLNLLIMVSLFPIRKREFFRREETLAVRGRGESTSVFRSPGRGLPATDSCGSFGQSAYPPDER